MQERFLRCGDVELCHETFGDPGDPTMLLVMGLGMQMVAWPDELCARLAGEGFFVVRYDNRDSGRSTHLTDLPAPTLWELVRRDGRRAGYSLEDMADDAAALLDGLERPAAHVVGVSMGGMIAQALAARHPDRVLSLTSMMSTTGNRWRGQPALRTYRYFIERGPLPRAEAVERVVRFFRLVGSPGFERDEDALRRTTELSFERASGDGAGTSRQLAAILASGDRTADLARVSAPTLVIHGTADRLVRPSGGRATARAIPGARLELVEGMGHDLPRGAWPRLVEAIAAHCRAAQPSTRMLSSGPSSRS
jgi:pimeloyl-ACP methyl ester carboxylesterase